MGFMIGDASNLTRRLVKNKAKKTKTKHARKDIDSSLPSDRIIPRTTVCRRTGSPNQLGLILTLKIHAHNHINSSLPSDGIIPTFNFSPQFPSMPIANFCMYMCVSLSYPDTFFPASEISRTGHGTVDSARDSIPPVTVGSIPTTTDHVVVAPRKLFTYTVCAQAVKASSLNKLQHYNTYIYAYIFFSGMWYAGSLSEGKLFVWCDLG